jgi:hypothetical protein
MSAGRFSPRRRRLVASLPVLAGGTLLGLDRAPAWAQSEDVTRPAPCDPATQQGCPLTLGTPFAAILANGTDVHTFRIAVPVDGEIGLVIAPLVPARVKADLDLYLFNANDDRLGAGLTADTRGPGFRDGESVQARVSAGSAYVIVHVKASSDRSVRDLPYTIRLFASPKIWRATVAATDARSSRRTRTC